MKSHQNKELQIIGERIRGARAIARLTQLQLAEKIGISDSALTRYESGERSIDARLLMCIADETGVSIEWLYGRSSAKAETCSLIMDIEQLFSQCNQQQIRFCYKQMEFLVKNVLENF
jgi:transcriptional regulator with XRE-family HTH domain